jgi:hypothetical protein
VSIKLLVLPPMKKQFFKLSVTVYHIGDKDVPKSELFVGVYHVYNPGRFRKLVESILPMNPKNRRIPPDKRVLIVREKLAEEGFVAIPELQSLTIPVF